MRIVAVMTMLFLNWARYVNAEPLNPLVQAALADQQLVMLGNLTEIKKPDPTNQLIKIPFGAIMRAREEGLSNKDVFEMAKKSNDPLLMQPHPLGYKLHPNVIAFLSPTNDIAAKTSPTPEPSADVATRFQNEEKIKLPAKGGSEVDDKREMQRIYDEMEKLQRKARTKVLGDPS